MNKDSWIIKHKTPLGIYVFIIAAIFFGRLYLPPNYLTALAAGLMLFPVLIKADGGFFRSDIKGIVTGLVVSAVLLAVYTLVLYLYALYAGMGLVVNSLPSAFILTQLLMVALPEEVFFRGYLQNRLGNNIKGVIIVSALFALGHFITLCLAGGHNISICSQAILTFFPSLVMGYLYLRTGTLWASIIFHFFANIVHIAVALS